MEYRGLCRLFEKKIEFHWATKRLSSSRASSEFIQDRDIVHLADSLRFYLDIMHSPVTVPLDNGPKLVKADEDTWKQLS